MVTENKNKSMISLDEDKSNISDLQIRPEKISVKEAIIDLYLNVKIRNSEEVSVFFPGCILIYLL